MSEKLLYSPQQNHSGFVFYQYLGQFITLRTLRRRLGGGWRGLDPHSGQHIGSVVSSELRLQSIKVNDPTKLRVAQETATQQQHSVKRLFGGDATLPLPLHNTQKLF